MEYVVIRAVHPTWLTLQFPGEVAELIRFAPPHDGGSLASRSVSFLSRGPGVARVIATYPAREALAIETVRNRLIATARPGERHLFSLPAQLAQHLGLKVEASGPHTRRTDDTLLWFLPAPEYYEYRSVKRSGKPWTGPSNAPFAHVYVAKSLLPFPHRTVELSETEYRIEEEEWRPGVEALQRVSRGRRVVL